ncbi:MAG: hypothetical protein GXP16_15840 [Gammaproteobacteria bacterium]|nr:hypothetical protein [Gammaproteobacteria bacterium]
MNNNQVKKLALDLMRADHEEDVIQILEKAGLWSNKKLWRLYGDKEGNFAQAGNQQSLPEAAFVEKIINSVDSRLMAECRIRKIDPESAEAPVSIRDAVAMFFEDRRANDDQAGALVNWSRQQRTKEARAITIAATGGWPTRGHKSKRMCLTITDQGEGQSAKRIPDTILSLNKKNKQRIAFVQGKFNMGGSGALRFCGGNRLQLVLSRRHPQLAEGERVTDDTTDYWAVTVVRREEPSGEVGQAIHSEFTYLAPLGSSDKPRHGEVMYFKATSLPILPQHNEPYAKEATWGTLIKLYEYETSVGQSNVLMKDGLMYSLERLLPEIALPVRIHECRKGYGGAKAKSFETNIAGLVVRLEGGKGDSLEFPPLTSRIGVSGMEMKARIFAFKESRADTYLKNEGVIFTINGQAHGHLPKSFFSRPKKVGLNRLRDSLLVIVDCSSLTVVQREDLFMSSRDRLSKNPLRYRLEAAIEDMLKTNKVLRRLQQERREQDVKSKLDDQKPLEQVLGKILRSSRALESVLLRGQRLSRPFRLGSGAEKGDKDGPGKQDRPFVGRKHPSYFKLAGANNGHIYHRGAELGRKCRIKYETDVENSYFDRATDRGTFELEILESDRELSEPDFSISLEDGEAHLNIQLPQEAKVGDQILLQTTVDDPTLIEPFVNLIRITVSKIIKHEPGFRKPRKSRGGGAGSEPSNSGIALPDIISVREGDEIWVRRKFTPATACEVETDEVPSEDSDPGQKHVFYINVDNRALQTEMKYSKQDPRLLEAKFKYGNVLVGLAMLHEAEEQNKGNGKNPETRESIFFQENGNSPEDYVRDFTEAIAPVLIPMIDQLSGLDESDMD